MPGSEAEPYVGLRPYEVSEASRFFGRERESYELTQFVLNSRLVVVYGPPGAGKTSLLQAGVLSGIGRDMAHVLPVATVPRAATLPSVSTPGPTPNPLASELLSSWVPDRAADVRQGVRISQVFQQIPAAVDRYGEGPLPLIAVADRFEEVFRAGVDWEPQRGDLLEQLAEAVDDVEHLHLIISISRDVMGQLLPYELKLSGGNRRRYPVDALDPDSALEAVTGPLRATERSFAPGAAEELVARLRTTTLTNEVGEQRTVMAPTVEPTSLQVVCSALWRDLPEDVATITTDHVREYGDVEDTFTNFCVRAVIDVAASEGIDVQNLWRWLEETFITDLGTRGAAYEGLAWTADMPNAVARAFERRRILRSEERSGAVWFELLHDSLIEPIRRGRRLSDGLAEVAGREARPDDYLIMAESALRSGMIPLAEEYAKGAVRASEHDVRTLAEAKSFLGELVFDHGRTETGDRAEELFTTAEDNFRQAAELFEAQQNSHAVGRVLASLGRLHLERGRFLDAVRDLRSALERLPGDASIRSDFARALHRSGQPQAALAEYSRVLGSVSIEDRSARVAAFIGRGTVGAEHGDPTAALRDLDEAVRLQPEAGERPEVVAARLRAVSRLERR
jgi:tetratricopeptide (TPR) repeat protein